MTTLDDATRYTSWAPAAPAPTTWPPTSLPGRHRAMERATLTWHRLMYTARHRRG